MISKNDALVLLANLKLNNVDTSEITKKLLSDGVSIEVLTFINNNRSLDLANFYEKLRRSYNDGHSKLYKSIVDESTQQSVKKTVQALGAYIQQIILFSDTVDNKQMFMRFTRLSEVLKALYYWSISYDPAPCIAVLDAVRSDVKILEKCYRDLEKISC